MPQSSELCSQLIGVALAAGRSVMKHYREGVEVSIKGDRTPVTQADTDAETIILEALGTIVPHIPVISEEAASRGVVPSIADEFFLVDPLDGTKEFINHNDEFTVNIGLIKNQTPVMGIVYAPALDRLFFAPARDKAFELSISCDATPNLDQVQRLHARLPPPAGLTAAVSRSHIDEKTDRFLSKFNIIERRSAGSSLKFCLIASGEVDIYPRTGPTMEWDTAAGHAVLVAAGGSVVTGDGNSLTYGKSESNYKNPPFTARGRIN